MSIGLVIDLLNKKYGLSLETAYYALVGDWLEWWRGIYEPFHVYHEQRRGKPPLRRELYKMGMAKKICEDWASVLLNDRTKLMLDDPASAKWLVGDDGIGGYFAESLFWNGANALIERAFASGTGAVLTHFENAGIAKDGKLVRSPDTRITYEYLDASGILPLTVRHGTVTDCAFTSDVYIRGKRFVYVETHLRERGGYRITNEYFSENDGALIPAELPEGVAAEIFLDTPYPMFALVSPNVVNTYYRPVGLGASVFAQATDNLKGVDLAYNNFNRDLYLGGKKVFINQSLTMRDESGNIIAPDDVAQQLFTSFGDEDLAANPLIVEHNPELRTTENRDAVQAQLDYLSFKCGFGTKHYQFNGTSIVTATQYSGDKQELIQHATKHYIHAESFLKAVARSTLWAAKNLGGVPVNPETGMSVQFDDSFFVDPTIERANDERMVSMGVMSLVEFRSKWMGEPLETAAKNLPAPADTVDD